MFRKFALNDSNSKIRRIMNIYNHNTLSSESIFLLLFIFFINCMCAVGSQRNCLIETVLWVPTAYVMVEMYDYIINSSFMRMFIFVW